jgi:hypothetical protein
MDLISLLAICLFSAPHNGYYHLGDLDVRLRTGASREWKSYSTAFTREPVTALPTPRGELATADLSPTMPADIPLQVIRSWSVEHGKLTLRYLLKNKTNEPVQIGALGIPMIFNNILRATGQSGNHDHSPGEAASPSRAADPHTLLGDERRAGKGQWQLAACCDNAGQLS